MIMIMLTMMTLMGTNMRRGSEGSMSRRRWGPTDNWAEKLSFSFYIRNIYHIHSHNMYKVASSKSPTIWLKNNYPSSPLVTKPIESLLHFSPKKIQILCYLGLVEIDIYMKRPDLQDGTTDDQDPFAVHLYQ